MDETDWKTFRFPSRPPKRGEEERVESVPLWAAPSQKVVTWCLDYEHLLIIHPKARKKIDLMRINTKRRLIQLVNLVKTQPTPEDIASLFSSLEQACYKAWRLTLAEKLADQDNKIEWPAIEEEHLRYELSPEDEAIPLAILAARMEEKIKKRKEEAEKAVIHPNQVSVHPLSAHVQDLELQVEAESLEGNDPEDRQQDFEKQKPPADVQVLSKIQVSHG